MANHRKSSRNRHKKPSDDDSVIKMQVYKLNRAIAVSEVYGTSIYEIDIKSSINFCDEATSNPFVKVCVANVAPLALEKQSNAKGVDFDVVENPFIKSHYPRFRETDSESERKLPSAEKVDLMIQTSLSSGNHCVSGQDLLKEQKPFDGFQSDEGNQSDAAESLAKLKKEMKKQALKGCLATADSAWPLSSHGSAENQENELLHLHHHEHHHHYHFEKKKQREGDDFVLYLLKPSSSELREVLTGGRKRFSRRTQTFDEDSSKRAYFYSCDSKSNATVAKVLISPDVEAFLDPEKANRGHKPKPSTSIKTFRSRPSSSSESVLNKKSYLLKSYNYSDTDLAKCDSDINISEPFPFDVLKSKDSTTDYSFLNSLRSPDPTGGPPLDQTSDVKAIYLKEPSTATVVFTETETTLECAPQEEETENRDSGMIPLTAKGSDNDGLEPVQTWAEKIKTELREIKRTLGVIEKEFLKKKNFMRADVNEAKTKTEEGSGHEISVYSSRTFILRAENLYIIEESENRALNEDIQSFFENDEICYAETERGHFFLSPNGSWLHFKGVERQQNVWQAESEEMSSETSALQCSNGRV